MEAGRYPVAWLDISLSLDYIRPRDGRPIYSGAAVGKRSRSASVHVEVTKIILGCVDNAYPGLDCGEFSEAEEAFGRVVVSGCDAPAFLEPAEEPLDPVVHGVERPVDGVLDLAVPLGWDLGGRPAYAQFAANIVGVVALVGEHDLRVSPALGHQGVKGGAVVVLARRQDQCDWKTLSAGPGMDFRREATARAAKSLALSPPPAPAAP